MSSCHDCGPAPTPSPLTPLTRTGHPAEHHDRPLRVGFVGNPNCGKTTLFNAYTGANLKVANWPGVTVERKVGHTTFSGRDIELVDLPGTYSLTCYTMEEQVTRDYVLSDDVDVIIDVVDASSLEHNLYLTIQLLELGKPVVVALNMMDVVRRRGMEVDTHRLPEMLGCPVVPVSARRREGLGPLMHAVMHHAGHARPDQIVHSHHAERGLSAKHRRYAMVYSEGLEEKIDEVAGLFAGGYPNVANPRYHAIKLLEADDAISRRYPVAADDGRPLPVLERSYEDEFIRERYDFISEVVNEVVFNRDARAAATDAADRLLTDKVWSIPIFLGIMAVVFALTFTVGDLVKSLFDMGLEAFSDWASASLVAIGASDATVSLVVDGVITGCGTVITFLPNIFILFLALAFLEDSGYMSRVAYVMDGVMGRLGLSGRAFIPMILGFGCSVPAIMASRALESPSDRRRVMLVTPFMSCSARLPIYILFSGMFFGRMASLVAYSMYVIGIVVALLVLLVLRRVDVASERATGVCATPGQEDLLLIELPEYKMPDLRTVWIYVWEKVKDYLSRAGTVIFVASVVMWFVLNFGPAGYAQGDMAGSFGAMLGHWAVPVLAPAGLGYWQVALALIAGVSAKEVVVSSISVLFGVGAASSAEGMTQLAASLSSIGFGPANALALMVFCLLYVPCMATIATIRRESGSRRYTAFAVCFQLVVAWALALVTFQAFHAMGL
ncbi:MAG: ferrous iron transport protein B [Atopobiaceae bacterium]|nr:ferrous iron transport protein B [Atopobiaceae bacterium]